VEIDERAARDTGRTNPEPGQRDTKGYTGFESLLNWLYYLVGTTNQFDSVAHSMHINLNTFETGPCGHVTSGRDPETGEVGVPAEGGGLTTNIVDAARCVQWLGPNQPGINEDLGLPPYDPRVCPNGTEPVAAEYLCDPHANARQPARAGGSGDGGRGGAGASPETGGGAGGDSGGGSVAQGSNGPVPDDLLDEILDLPEQALDDLPQSLEDELRGLGGGIQRGLDVSEPRGAAAGATGLGGTTGAAAEQLLDFLFSG
jgi:hypothetical protein